MTTVCDDNDVDPNVESFNISDEDLECEKMCSKNDFPVVRLRPKKIVFTDSSLPVGWEKHTDEVGVYYWHVESGTIQRDVPNDVKNVYAEIVRSVRSSLIINDSDRSLFYHENIVGPPMAAKAEDIYGDKEHKKWKRRSLPVISGFPHINKKGDACALTKLQVCVSSFGWQELSEEDLESDRSSKAVNRCIVQLTDTSTNQGSFSQWGSELTLLLQDGVLSFTKTEDGTPLHSQPIHSIRVWGVGRDNPFDFAYVARDRQTRSFVCHVFRCFDVPAKTVANALRDACKKILIERSLSQSSSRITINNFQSVKRTNNDPSTPSTQLFALDLLPSPKEREPRIIWKALFLGTVQVTVPSGMDVINESIDHLMNTVKIEKWNSVHVFVTPSTIGIRFDDGHSSDLECRVRFLSFLGISSDCKQRCAYIMHTSQNTFVSYVFQCDPSAGPFCKSIEAACKLRYQKCLDARPPPEIVPKSSNIGRMFKNIIGAFGHPWPSQMPKSVSSPMLSHFEKNDK